MQNFINFFSQTIKEQNAFYVPAGDGKISFVDVRDIARVAVQALLYESKHGRKDTILLVQMRFLMHKQQRYFLMK